MKTSKISLQILANTMSSTAKKTGGKEAQTQHESETLAISIEQPDVFSLGETKAIPFKFNGYPINFEILEAPYGWSVSLLKLNEKGGTLAVTASNFSLQLQSTLSLICSNGIVAVKKSLELTLDPLTVPVGTICHENGKSVGVVFRPKTKHQKGLIVHKNHAVMAWGDPVSITYATDRDNGQNNMARIKTIDTTFEDYPSFSWCCNHGEHWYMPSLHELLCLYHSRAEVNTCMYEISGIPLATDGTAYWASNEVNDKFAWSVYFQDGHLNYHKKGYDKLVRAICAF